MVRKTYICNVCRTEFSEEKQADIVGFEFVGSRDAKPLANFAANNHICLNCLDVTRKLDSLLPPRPRNSDSGK